MKTRAIRSLSGAVLVLCSLIVGLANSAVAQLCLDKDKKPKPCYELWVPLGAYDQNSANTKEHSGLVTWNYKKPGDEIQDTAFANMFKPLVQGGVPFLWVFSQCFGGGMFDELNVLGGVQSGISASSYRQRAIYQLPLPLGNGVNFSTAYIQAIRNNITTAEPMASKAADNDPWGPSPGPTPPRDLEIQNSEQPVYFTIGAGADALKLSDYKDNGVAILWSGEPDEVLDGAETSRLILELIRLKYKPTNIWVLYGSGKYSKGTDFVGIAVNNNLPATQLRAATRKQLQAVANKIVMNNNNFVFFFANDHGWNNARGGAVPRAGWEGQIPYNYYPPGTDDIGSGDEDLE